jgi:hypothetical protein
MENVDTQSPVSTSEPASKEQVKEVNIMDVPVSNPNIALNVMVFFLNSAQRRGAFSMDESAKVWEAVKMFVTPEPATTGDDAASVENTMESTD